VLENYLGALVIESLPEKKERSMRDVSRVREIGKTAYRAFFFVSSDDALISLPKQRTRSRADLVAAPSWSVEDVSW
jgi:hypothetical protein